jgi:2-haloacid dehalogenase
MRRIKAIVFDLGGVLIDWNPFYVFNDTYFPSKEDRDYFFENVCTSDWNENQDAGYSIARATEEKVVEFPEWEKAIRDFYGKWDQMLGEELKETVDTLKLLKEIKHLKIYALTNWSAETFPRALEKFPFLQWFDGIVVSGIEKMRKPSEEFYQLLLDRFNLTAAEVFFIDDNLRNIRAAEKMGMQVMQFTTASALEKKLKELDLLN